MNITCAICSDLFMPSDDMHITPCGHSFHLKCLTQWFQRSKTCPQCRNKCTEKNIIKVYFNITTNLDATLDTGSLLHKIDNIECTLREKVKIIKTLEEKSSTFKDERKKMHKTIKCLEEMTKQKEFALISYKEEVNILRLDRQHADKLQNEIKKLKEKIDLMATVELVITSTAKEVEQMLAQDDNPRTLAVMVASLKRELKAVDIKKNEIRERWKSGQNDLHQERQNKRKLEEKVVSLESENYRLEQENKRLEEQLLDVLNKSSGSEDLVINGTPQPKRKLNRQQDLNNSTPLADKVKKILDSDSPYLKIKSSSIGLTPFLRGGLGTSKSSETISSTGAIGKTQSDLSDRFSSIFKKPRLGNTLAGPLNQNRVYNGLGGTEKKENFPDFPRLLQSTSTTTLSRLKSGKLKKLANQAPSSRLEDFDFTL